MTEQPEHRRPASPPASEPAPISPPGAAGNAAPNLPAVSDAESISTGSGLGKYRILDRLGSNDHATLYRARDSLLDRLVVVKQLAPHLADDPRACGRFRREAYILAQAGVESRYVVKIHELIEERRGLFIVTEYVPGETLEAVLLKRPPAPQTALDLLGRLAMGLRAVHGAGVIHRNLTPHHVVIDPQGRPHITDFSLATAGGAELDFTITSPRYTAPEIFLQRPFDERVDLYSLGVAAYEMLVGRTAFDELVHRYVGGNTAEHWAAWHRQPESSLPEPHTLNRRIPPVLSAIVSRLTSKAIDQRIATADDLIVLLLQNFSRSSRAVSIVPPAPGAPILPPPTGYAAPSTAAPLHASGPAPYWPALPGPPPDAGYVTSAPAPIFAPPSGAPQTTTIRAATRDNDFFRPRQSGMPAASASFRRQPVVPISAPIDLKQIRCAAPMEPWSRRRSARTLRRAAIAAVVLAAIGAGGYGVNRVYPFLPSTRYHQLGELFILGRDAYTAGRFSEAIELFEKALKVPVKGARLYDLHADILRWLPLAQAQRAMQKQDFDSADQFLREASNRGIDRELINPLRRELIKAQSAARLRMQLGEEESRRLLGLDDAPPAADGAPASDAVPADSQRTHGASDRPAAVETPEAPASAPTHDPVSTAPTDRLPESTAVLGPAESKTQREYNAAYDAVIDALRRRSPRDADDALLKLKALASNGEVDELTSRVQALRYFSSYVALGDGAMKNSDYEEAAEHYRKASRFEMNPQIQAKLNRALAMDLIEGGKEAARHGDWKAAMKKLQAAAWRDPHSEAPALIIEMQDAEAARGRVRAGDEAASAGKWREAIDCYEEAYHDLLDAERDEVDAKLEAARAELGQRKKSSRD